MATSRRKQLLIEGIDLEVLNPRGVSRRTRLTAAGMGATIAASRFAAIAGGAVLGVGGFGGVALAADQPMDLGLTEAGPDALRLPPEQYWATSWNEDSSKRGNSDKKKKNGGNGGGGSGNTGQPNNNSNHNAVNGNTGQPNNNNNHANNAGHGGGGSPSDSGPSRDSSDKPKSNGSGGGSPSKDSAPKNTSNGNGGGQGNVNNTNNGGGNEKIGICHATGSQSNPFVFIRPSKNSEEAHRHHQHQEDVIGADSSSDCPRGETKAAAGTVDVQSDSSSATKNTAGSSPTDSSATNGVVVVVNTAGGGGNGGGGANNNTGGNNNTGATGGTQGFVPAVAGAFGERSNNNGVIQSGLFIPAGGEMTPQQAQAIADHVGGGLGAEDVLAMTPEEVAGVIGAAGMEGTVGGVVVAPAALPQAGDFLPIAGQAALGFGALLAGAGALMRRMSR